MREKKKERKEERMKEKRTKKTRNKCSGIIRILIFNGSQIIQDAHFQIYR
jgi:hypothetical protein